MQKGILTIFIILIGIVSLPAQKKFDFNANCIKAYHDALSLKIAAAQIAMDLEKKTNPDNLVPYLVDNYIDFFTLFFNEDPDEYKRKAGNREKRLDLMDEAPDDSPLKLLSQSIINLQWAAVEIKFGNRWAAGWAFRDAFKLAKENQRLFPGFTPNLMITGPMQMAASTIPKGYRWLSSILGIKGTMTQGQLNLKQFISAKDSWATLFMEEGIFYQCYMQFYLLNQPDAALQFIKSHQLDVVNNHLFAYMAANLYLNNKQSAMSKLIVEGRNLSPAYMTTGIWDFEMAFAKLYHLEPDADVYFERYLKNFKGNFYVKDVWLKLAMHYLLANSMQQYNRCINNAITKGTTNNDADKRALKEAKGGKRPNILLLKARLLSDGGYQREALNLLVGKNSNQFVLPEDKLEFMYRVARINDELGNYDAALQAYQSTINFGKSRTEYFAARAALQVGIIYEKRGDKTKAIDYFQQCIGMEGHDFEDSLEQKAKAGLARCKNI